MVMLSGAVEATGLALGIEWVLTILAAVAAVASAPGLVAWLRRREQAKLDNAMAARTSAEVDKTDAEAEHLRHNMAQAWLDRYERRFAEQEAENSELRRRITHLEEQRDADAEAQAVHTSWDYMAIDQLRMAGVTMPPAPPLRMAVERRGQNIVRDVSDMSSLDPRE